MHRVLYFKSITVRSFVATSFVAITLCFPFNTMADTSRVFINGEDLKNYCEQSSNFCFGYVTAVVDDVTVSSGTNPYCLPADINVETLQEVVIRFMNANPELLKITGAEMVKLALESSYNCE